MFSPPWCSMPHSRASVVESSLSPASRPVASPIAGLPPGPATPAWLQTWRYTRDPLPLLEQCAREFGDLFTLRLLGTGAWGFVWSPALLKVLFTIPSDVAHAGEANASVFGPISGPSTVFTMDGAAHLGRRRLLLPQFHGDRMQVYFDQVRDIAADAVAAWPRAG